MLHTRGVLPDGYVVLDGARQYSAMRNTTMLAGFAQRLYYAFAKIL